MGNRARQNREARRRRIDGTKVLVMELSGKRQRKITVAAHCKVTFGPVNPGSHSNRDGEYCLRVYDTAERQLAAFTDVIAFRDESIDVLERVTSTKAQRVYRDTPNGRKEAVAEVTVTEWRNPDKPEEYEAKDTNFMSITDKSDL